MLHDPPTMTNEPDLQTEVTYKPLIADALGQGRGWGYTALDHDGNVIRGQFGFESENEARQHMDGVIRKWLAESLHYLTTAGPSEFSRRAALKRLEDPSVNKGGRVIGYSGDDKFCDPVTVGRQFLSLAAELGNQNEAARRIYREQEGAEPPEGEALRSYKRKLKRWAKGA